MEFMRGRIRTSIVLSAIVGLTSGCAGTHQARYVYQDGQFGVVGIPSNTERWPTHYRTQAEELMARHFPQGYEIVRAEEVVEGSRVLTTHGSGTAEVGAGLPLPVLKIGTIGLSSSRNQADSVKIKECRILYKKAEPGGAPKGERFAEQASLTPTTYLDPNALARKQAEGKESKALAEQPAGHEPDKAESLARHAPASSAGKSTTEPDLEAY
jgi:hypothetical protein